MPDICRPSACTGISDVVVFSAETASVDVAVAHLVQQGVTALAICFLNAYVNPVHEEEAAAFIRDKYPDLEVTASYEVAREWREYDELHEFFFHFQYIEMQFIHI